jgi:hypothetical protein
MKTIVTSLFISAIAFGRYPTAGAKGSEIYCWKNDHGTSYYSLVAGTNALKTKKIIFESGMSLAELLDAIDQIPVTRGTYLTLEKANWATRFVAGVNFFDPPAETRDQILAHARAKESMRKLRFGED